MKKLSIQGAEWVRRMVNVALQLRARLSVNRQEKGWEVSTRDSVPTDCLMFLVSRKWQDMMSAKLEARSESVLVCSHNTFEWILWLDVNWNFFSETTFKNRTIPLRHPQSATHKISRPLTWETWLWRSCEYIKAGSQLYASPNFNRWSRLRVWGDSTSVISQKSFNIWYHKCYRPCHGMANTTNTSQYVFRKGHNTWAFVG